MRRLDLNTKKKTLWVILEFLNLKGKVAKLWKNQIFRSNSAPNYFSVTKFHKKKLDLITKQNFGDFGISNFKEEEGENL